jgi:hypothetical protein
MMHKIMRLGLVLVFCLLLPTSTQAGGWATATVLELPRSVYAGETVALTFVVRQHGLHLTHVPGAYFTAQRQGRQEVLRIDAQVIEPLGYHHVEVTFPTAGVWTWRFEPAPFASSGSAMLTVSPAKEADLVPRLSNYWMTRLLRFFARDSTVEAASSGSALSDVDYGHILFIAKGCTTCHVHAEVAAEWSTEVGPNLTDGRYSTEYLHTWLRNSGTLTERLQWGMPTLELTDEEIDALAAFLNQN